MEFLINLSKPRKAILISEITPNGNVDIGTVSISDDKQTERFHVGDEQFKLLSNSGARYVRVIDPSGRQHKVSYSRAASINIHGSAYQFILRDELLPESTPKVPKYVKHSFALHVVLFAVGVTLSLFQPKVPEKIVFEVETTFVEKETPPPAPPPEPPKVVEVKPEPIKKFTPAQRTPAPVKKTVAKFPRMKNSSPVRKVVVVPKSLPPAPAAASTPNPAAQAAAAQRASVAKALNLMSAATGGAVAGPTFTKNKQGSIYGAGSEQTLNAKNPSILSKLGAKSQDGNITTKGSRMISTTAGIKGNGKGLNDVQGRVSADNLYNGGNLEGTMGGSGLDLSGDGTVAQSLIEKVLAKHIDKLRYCYEKALLSDASLGGNVLLQWTIATSGQARNIRTLRSAISSSQMQTCINREISKIPFPRPAGGEVIVKFPFNFTSSSI